MSSDKTRRQESSIPDDMFRITLKCIGDAVIATDAVGHVTIINDVAQHITGWNENEALGRDISEIFVIVNEETRKPVDNPVLMAIKNGRVVGLANHTILISKHGHEIPIDDSGAPVFNTTGEIIGAVLVFRDIAERRASEKQLSFLFEAVSLLASSLDYEMTLQNIGKLAVPLLADCFILDLFLDNMTTQTVIASHEDPSTMPLIQQLTRYPLELRAAHRLETLLENQTVSVDISKDDSYAKDNELLQLLLELKLLYAHFVPVTSQDRVLGIMSLYSTGYSNQELALAVAQQIAVALQNAQFLRDVMLAREEAERANNRLSRSQKLTDELSKAHTVMEVTDILVNQGLDSIGAESGFIALLVDNNKFLQVVNNRGYSSTALRQWQYMSVNSGTPLAAMIRSQVPVWFNSKEDLTRQYPDTSSETRGAAAAIPLIANGQIIGGIWINFPSENEFNYDEQQFIIWLARKCAEAITIARMQTNTVITHNSVFGSPIGHHQYNCDIFMIMPFASQFQSIYDDYIKPLAQTMGYEIKRGDNFFGKSSIMKEIWTAISNSKLIIAECTGRNPNVLYELGIAHTLDKTGIMITQNIDDIPFDIRHLRVIEYVDNAKGLVKLRSDLENAIRIQIS